MPFLLPWDGYRPCPTLCYLQKIISFISWNENEQMGLWCRIIAFIIVCDIPSNCHILLYLVLVTSRWEKKQEMKLVLSKQLWPKSSRATPFWSEVWGGVERNRKPVPDNTEKGKTVPKQKWGDISNRRLSILDYIPLKDLTPEDCRFACCSLGFRHKL